MPTLTGRVPVSGRIAAPPTSGLVLWLRADSGVTVSDETIFNANDFAAATWTFGGGFTSTPNATIDPFGGSAGNKLTVDLSVGNHDPATQPSNRVGGVAETRSVYAKAGTGISWVAVGDNTGLHWVFVNLANGTTGVVAGLSAFSVTPAGNGWYLISATSAGFNATFAIFLANGDGGNAFAGDGVSFLYLYTASVSQPKVSAWADQSGLGHHLTQVTAANQPLLARSAENGSVTVQFDASGGDSLASAAFTLNQPEDVFAVMRVISQGTAGVQDIGWDGITAGNMVLGNIIAGVVAISAGVGLSYSGVDLAFPAYDYVECQYNGASSVVNTHGLALGSTGNAGANNAGGFTLGGLANGTRGMNAEYTEILIYNRILSAAERTQLNNYLKWRYDIPDPMPFIPPLLPGCVLWLRADLGVTLNAGNVSAWADQSGLGNDVTQATAADQPLLVASAQNGRPGVRFDGVDDSLDRAATNFFGSGAYSMVTAQKLNSIVANTAFLSDAIVTAGVAFYISGANRTVLHQNVEVHSDAAAVFTPETWVVSRAAASAPTMLLNGAPTALSNTNPAVNDPGAGAVLSVGRFGGLANYTAVDVYEVICYTRALTTAEQVQLANYLRARYATP
jgi:hypothetical protein